MRPGGDGLRRRAEAGRLATNLTCPWSSRRSAACGAILTRTPSFVAGVRSPFRSSRREIVERGAPARPMRRDDLDVPPMPTSTLNIAKPRFPITADEAVARGSTFRAICASTTPLRARRCRLPSPRALQARPTAEVLCLRRSPSAATVSVGGGVLGARGFAGRSVAAGFGFSTSGTEVVAGAIVVDTGLRFGD